MRSLLQILFFIATFLVIGYIFITGFFYLMSRGVVSNQKNYRVAVWHPSSIHIDRNPKQIYSCKDEISLQFENSLFSGVNCRILSDKYKSIQSIPFKLIKDNISVYNIPGEIYFTEFQMVDCNNSLCITGLQTAPHSFFQIKTNPHLYVSLVIWPEKKYFVLSEPCEKGYVNTLKTDVIAPRNLRIIARCGYAPDESLQTYETEIAIDSL